MSEEDQTEQPSKQEIIPEPTPLETATVIADTLGEKEEGARKQILHIVWALGRTQTRTLLQQTLDIEASGGVQVPDGSRRRTPGGVFFHLAYTTGVPKPGKRFQRPPFRKPDGAKKPKPRPVGEQKQEEILTFEWKDRIAVISLAEETKGTANVKITVVGRPGKIIDRGQCIVTVMESSKVPALPKGLPTPPNATTKYTVYIAAKQWKKVAESIADPEDVLIVEGFPTMDTEAHAIAVFATNTTTKKLQQAQREAQKSTQD